jgi:osmoprotectant transport system substrate-binding protein
MRRLVPLAVLLIVLQAACGGDPRRSSASAGGLASEGAPTIRLGTKNFTEQYVLGQLYTQALEAQGFDVELKPDIGATEVAHRALESGAIDVYPEYTGTILSVVKGEARIPQDQDRAYAEAQRFERGKGLELLARTPFQNQDAVAVLERTAGDLRTLDDLRARGSDATLGGSPEYRTRLQGYRGLRDVYGIRARYKSVPIGSVYPALRDGSLTAGSAFTTDGELAGGEFRLLEDTRGLFGAQNVAPLVSGDLAGELGPGFARTMDRVSAALTTDVMQRLNAEAAEREPADVARRFLDGAGLLEPLG